MPKPKPKAKAWEAGKPGEIRGVSYTIRQQLQANGRYKITARFGVAQLVSTFTFDITFVGDTEACEENVAESVAGKKAHSDAL